MPPTGGELDGSDAAAHPLTVSDTACCTQVASVLGLMAVTMH